MRFDHSSARGFTLSIPHVPTCSAALPPLIHRNRKNRHDSRTPREEQGGGTGGFAPLAPLAPFPPAPSPLSCGRWIVYARLTPPHSPRHAPPFHAVARSPSFLSPVQVSDLASTPPPPLPPQVVALRCASVEAGSVWLEVHLYEPGAAEPRAKHATAPRGWLQGFRWSDVLR
jgi:hypothetical protein